MYKVLLVTALVWFCLHMVFIGRGKPTRKIAIKQVLSSAVQVFTLVWVMMFIVTVVTVLPDIIEWTDLRLLEASGPAAAATVFRSIPLFVVVTTWILVFRVFRISWGVYPWKLTVEEKSILGEEGRKWRLRHKLLAKLGRCLQI